jgi:hypothetical protein
MVDIVHSIKGGLVNGDDPFGTSVFDTVIPQIYKIAYRNQYTIA